MRQSYSDYFSEQIHHIDRNNNMGLVRYILAFGVLIAHFNFLCGADVPWIISSYYSVGGFFALSGFVLIGSLFKGTSFKDFLIKRAWRILPSYFFVVITSAVFLVFVSEFNATDYFTSSGFWKYLAANLSFLNFLHPSLPGIFDDPQNIENAVNGSLWTMKIEWQLSISAPIFVWLCKHYKLNIRKAIFAILVISLIYKAVLEQLYFSTNKQIYEILGRQLFGQLLFFYGGILLYTLYDYMIKHKMMFVIISTAVYFSSMAVFKNYGFYNLYIHPFIIVCMVISFSIIPGDIASKIDKGHNISYEIYLCHYPVLQLIAYFGLTNRIGIAWSLITATILTIIVSVFTYYTVGRLYILHNSNKFKTCLRPLRKSSGVQ